MKFLQHLTSLAPEGETVLIVKQKSTKVNGYAWVPYLPSQYARGGAWYGNTGLFILDRMKGKLSASVTNCTHVGVMVLDDVGTKSAVPPLAPTWIIETSPANYQWGYVFNLDQQPTTQEFAPAIKAIADAGFTDGGAINPVRNFRLPGSVNLKPGRDEFASVLTEFHPDRFFTLQGICDALGVTPAEADTATVRPLNLDDDGTDDVLAWLSEQGYLLASGNGAGWWGVVCPNSAEHTTGSAEGRYMPSNRAYKCLHEHCSEWDSNTFLDWVAAQGGPKRFAGLRDELLAAKLRASMEHIKPTDKHRGEAAAVLEEIERKELGRIERDKWFNRFAYIQDDESFFDLEDRREISRNTFNALFRHVTCHSIHQTGKAKRRIEASVCYDEHRQAKGAKSLVGITYAAGETVLVGRDGDVYGNRWRDARPVGGSGDVTMWLDHCRLLVPDERELNHILDVMACKLQHPEIKINHAVLHAGDQGCGKDSMWAPFLWSVCGEHLKNRGLLDNDTLGSQWGYQLESEILIINELREPDAKERRALANKLKPLIAAPPDMIPINRKGLHPYMMLNRMFVLAFSNDPVPISLDSQDRRWFCVWSHAPRMQPTAATALWNWYKSGGFAAVAGFLHSRDVSKFNPSAAPMLTEFKSNLVEHGMTMGESYLVELIRARLGEFSRGVVASPFHALCDRLSGAAPSGVKIYQSALLHALKEAQWVDCGRCAAQGYNNKRHIFCSPDMATMSKSDLRRLAEDTPPPATVRLVK